MCFLYRGETSVNFHFGALEKDKLSLNKLMPPKAQFGVLLYRGQDKPHFSIPSFRERDVTIEQINVSESSIWSAFHP